MKRKKTKPYLCQKKGRLTLLEMLMVFLILGLLSGLIGINVRKAMQEQQFKAEVQKVLNTLRLAQDLMLLLKQDVHVVFKENGKEGIDYELIFDFPLDKQWEKLFKRPKVPLKSIHRIEFLEDKKHIKDPLGMLQLSFLSGGSVMSQGVLLLSNQFLKNENVNEQIRYICLPGYPSPLAYTLELPSCYSLKEAFFDEELTTLTTHEIHALQQ